MAERPSVTRLKELFTYNPDTGDILRRVTVPAGPAGSSPGHTDARGYTQIMIDGYRTRAHRVAYAMHHGQWPDIQVDHINGDPGDNRACNLRSATSRENMANRSKRNVLQFGRKFRAAMIHNGERYNLGIYPDAESAYAVACFADVYLNKEFAHSESLAVTEEAVSAAKSRTRVIHE